MKLNTVNVIEMVHDDIINIQSFTDDEEGNRQAEKLFELLVKKHESNDVTESNMDVYLEEGVFDDDCGYQIVIVHSN